MNRDVEQNGVLKTCGELESASCRGGPMGQGYLTAKIDARTKFDPKNDTRSEFPRFLLKTCSKYADWLIFSDSFSGEEECNTGSNFAGLAACAKAVHPCRFLATQPSIT